MTDATVTELQEAIGKVAANPPDLGEVVRLLLVQSPALQALAPPAVASAEVTESGHTSGGTKTSGETGGLGARPDTQLLGGRDSQQGKPHGKAV